MSAPTTSPTTADPEILHLAARQLQTEAKRDHGVFLVFIILNVVVLVMCKASSCLEFDKATTSQFDRDHA